MNYYQVLHKNSGDLNISIDDLLALVASSTGNTGSFNDVVDEQNSILKNAQLAIFY